MTPDSDDLTEVYETAQSLLPAAESFAKQVGLDAQQAEETLMQAADNVLKAKGRGIEILNLPGYLFTAYKRLVLGLVRRNRNEEPLVDGKQEQLSVSAPHIAQDLEKKILVEEIARRMDPQSKFIFEYLLLGYSYHEIAGKFSERFGVDVKDNALRSKFSKTVHRLEKELESS